MNMPIKLKVIYVAGPYRAETPLKTLHNIRRAEAVALQIWQAGHVALTPHMNTRLFDGECPDEMWLAGGLELLRRCDAVMLVPGWENSAGTLIEIEEARRLGMGIYKTMEEIIVDDPIRACNMQLTVKKLRSQIENLPDDMPVFFRRIAPICGNIEEASAAIPSQFSAFGIVYPCLIIEPFEADT